VAALIDRARDHYRAGHKDEAAALYQQILEQDPDHLEALLLAALLLLDGAQPAAAEPLLRRYRALDGGNPHAHQALGKLLQDRGDDGEAVAHFKAAIVCRPEFPTGYTDLGLSLHRLYYRETALHRFNRATVLDPDFAGAHFHRGLILVEKSQLKEAALAFRRVLVREPDWAEGWFHLGTACTDPAKAEAAFKRAIRIDPDCRMAYLQLAYLCEGGQRDSEARQYLLESIRRAGVAVEPCISANQAPRVLLIGGAGGCNVPTQALFDRRRFSTVTVHLLPQDEAGPEQATLAEHLPVCDIAFNAIADMDGGEALLTEVEGLCARLPIPLLNAPAGLRPTRRDRAPRLLAGIPGLVVPVTERLDRQALAAMTVDQPLLVRPLASHGGQDLVRIDSKQELANLLARLSGDWFYVTQYFDYRSADGWYRKYRLIFVDRQVFPYHLAIARHWLIHYFRAEDMKTVALLRREEEEFLSDWRSVFAGERAAVIEEVARRLDLDYAGIDCGLTQEGRVVLFEANANMLVKLDESIETFPYKHRTVPRIFDAIDAMVARRLNAKSSDCEIGRPQKYPD